MPSTSLNLLRRLRFSSRTSPEERAKIDIEIQQREAAARHAPEYSASLRLRAMAREMDRHRWERSQ